MSIQVVLADDHPIVRNGIRYVIERAKSDIEIVAEASNGMEVLELSDRVSADVYVIDILMPILNGIDTTARLIKKNSLEKVIILSMHHGNQFVERAMRAGALGYVSKESVAEEIVYAIREVHKRRNFLSPIISNIIVNGFLANRSDEANQNLNQLTHREREILQLIAEGYKNKDITNRLNLSLNTVLVHRRNIMQKLDIHNKVELIRYAIKEGIAKL
jgi:DNA-binding NarL/FixJ family response regulator